MMGAADREKAAPLIQRARDRAAAVERLRAVEPHAVDGATAEDMSAGCDLLDVVEGGEVVGAVAVEIVGDTAVITAAASDGAHTYAELAAIERQLRAMGVKRLRMFTKRPGLVRNLAREGYRLDSAELSKEL